MNTNTASISIKDIVTLKIWTIYMRLRAISDKETLNFLVICKMFNMFINNALGHFRREYNRYLYEMNVKSFDLSKVHYE